jgi:hypothetical protein
MTVCIWDEYQRRSVRRKMIKYAVVGGIALSVGLWRHSYYPSSSPLSSSQPGGARSERAVPPDRDQSVQQLPIDSILIPLCYGIALMMGGLLVFWLGEASTQSLVSGGTRYMAHPGGFSCLAAAAFAVGLMFAVVALFEFFRFALYGVPPDRF